MQEELLAFAIQAVKDKHGAEIEELFGLEVQVPAVPFPRVPLAEALEIVKARGAEVPRTDGDLDPEGERQISAHVEETYGHQFVFITNHPEIRRSTTCATSRPAHQELRPISSRASRSRPARSASTASTC